MLEVNSKPSQAISVEGDGGQMERSPVDVEVKQRIMTDMLNLVTGAKRSTMLKPVLGPEASRKRAPLPSAGLVERARRIFELLTQKDAQRDANGSVGGSGREGSGGGGLGGGMGS